MISDIKRSGRDETGWDLLADVKEHHPELPFIFYTMGITNERRSEAGARGAAGITASPVELARLVFSLIPEGKSEPSGDSSRV